MSGVDATQQPRISRMRPTQRMDLLDQIGRELQRRFTFGEIEEFLSACGIAPPKEYNGPNSKWVFAKFALKDRSKLHVARNRLGIGFGAGSSK